MARTQPQNDRPLDRWLQVSLAERYAKPVQEPLPDEIRMLLLQRATG